MNMQSSSHISKASSVQLANKTNYNEPFALRMYYFEALFFCSSLELHGRHAVEENFNSIGPLRDLCQTGFNAV